MQKEDSSDRWDGLSNQYGVQWTVAGPVGDLAKTLAFDKGDNAAIPGPQVRQAMHGQLSFDFKVGRKQDTPKGQIGFRVYSAKSCTKGAFDGQEVLTDKYYKKTDSRNSNRADTCAEAQMYEAIKGSLDKLKNGYLVIAQTVAPCPGCQAKYAALASKKSLTIMVGWEEKYDNLAARGILLFHRNLGTYYFS